VFSAVYSDRSGRLVVAADYTAAVPDGASAAPLVAALPLPAHAEVVPLPERAAIGIDRGARPRPLGAGRFAVAAILPLGHVRLACPAYADLAGAQPLRPRAYAAVGADRDGNLVVAATAIDETGSDADGRMVADLPARISAGLREQPSSRLVRQLARCAKDYRCRAAANAFLGRHDCALPTGAPANERPPGFVSLRDERDASPTETATFRPTVDELGDMAVRHLDGGGTMVTFGRACEGEPLLAAREVSSAIAAIRERTPRGTIHLETNGSIPAALRRLIDAGLDSVAFRVASARPDTFEALHRPDDFRLAEVRVAIAEAAARKIAVAIRVLVLPGLFDRPRELDALVALTDEMPTGSALILQDLAADPQRALGALAAAETAIGVGPAIKRLRVEAAHVHLAAAPRPLVRL
jgi:pyruvate-formate lyase-activating enzyme